MADNVDITPGSGSSIAADEVVDATLGTVKVQYVKLMDGTLDGTTKGTISSNGLKVDGSAVVQPVSGPLTDTQLRLTAVPVSGTFYPATQAVSAASLPLPSGASTSALQTQPGVDIGDVTINNASGASAVNVQDGGNSITVDGSVSVSNFPSSQAVTGTFYQATQPVSVSSVPLPSGASTEATLALIKAKTDNIDVLLSTRTKPADTQPVSGTFWQATQPVSGPLTDTQLRASAVPISGTFWQTTQPVSAASLPLPTGAATETTSAACKTDLDKLTFTSTRLLVDGSGVTQPVSGTFWQSTQPVSGTFWQVTQPVSGTVAATESGTWTVQPGNTANTTPWLVAVQSANLLISATAATGVGVTATLPAVASQFHYIGLIEITKIFTAANAASATPLLVTSTNLPGSYTISFGQPLGTIGTAEERVYPFEYPIKSSTVNTNTTIVCPATTGIIWRVNVHYYAAV